MPGEVETDERQQSGTVRSGPANEVDDVVRLPRVLWQLLVSTVRICLRYRVTGLAAEAGFFALLSLPPLLLGLVGAVGFAGEHLPGDTLADLKSRLGQVATAFLSTDAVQGVILPTYDNVVTRGRIDIVSIGFLLALWSGSRALNVFVDTISIMYGLGGHRGIVRTRMLSFSLYLVSLVLGVVVIPLMLLGPGLLTEALSGTVAGKVAPDLVDALYWPVVCVVSVVGLSLLYHVATPIRVGWRRDLPGAALALTIWVLSSFVLRLVIAASVGGTSIYGPLATPIVVLIWLYFLAIAVLIGAALNAALEERFPMPRRVAARELGGRHEDQPPLTPVRDEPKLR